MTPDQIAEAGDKDITIPKGSLDVAEFLLEEAKIALVPGIAFSADNHQRLSFATSMENIEEGMNRIESALKSLPA